MTPLPPARLARRLGLAEAAGMSVAIISPSIGMAFNVTLVAAVAGPAVPLTFALATAVMTVVALSFVAFSRRQAHAGAAYAFVAHAFGPPAGALAGWAMLLTYGCFGMGLGMLVGIFLAAALRQIGLAADWLMLPLALSALTAAAFLAWRDVRLAGRLMLALEFLSVSAILLLAADIVLTLPRESWSWAPFSLHSAPGGWRGLGFALVFALLSFAGFEGAATLGEEAREPARVIPVAMLGSVLCTGLMYTLVSTAVVLGFGVHDSAALAQSAAPLDTLAQRHLGAGFAALLDLCCATSAFSGALGSISGGVRILFAMSRGGLSPFLDSIDRTHHTPARAIILFTLLSALPLASLLFGTDPGAFYGNTGEMGTIAIIAVYACVTLGETVEAARARKWRWVALGLAGSLCLAWAMLCTLLPSQGGSSPVWPLLVAGWLVLGGLVLMLRPRLRAWREGD